MTSYRLICRRHMTVIPMAEPTIRPVKKLIFFITRSIVCGNRVNIRHSSLANRNLPYNSLADARSSRREKTSTVGLPFTNIPST